LESQTGIVGGNGKRSADISRKFRFLIADVGIGVVVDIGIGVGVCVDVGVGVAVSIADRNRK
jgi:hypothetical protein